MRASNNVATRLVLVSFSLLSPVLSALPLGFGTIPGGQSYDELKSKNFYIYHDHATPHEAQATLNALEAARPYLEKWFEKTRTSPIPVVMSATTDNASFANFITAAIELQTMGQGSRDLAWHEYVHSTMYQHFLNWLGPAGSVLHLMWLPSWYVEGLAEALSVSIGSDQQALIERYHAMTGRWPSYARMHALYGDSRFGFRGYAAAGAFTAYLLRNYQTKNLPEFLNSYFHKSMPWMWPYSLLPLKTSMPLDNSLVSFTKKTGEEHYALYRKAAEEHWSKKAGSDWFVVPPLGEQFEIASANSIRTDQGKAVVTRFVSDKQRYVKAELRFDKNGWANGYKSIETLPENSNSTGHSNYADNRWALTQIKSAKGYASYQLRFYNANDTNNTDIVFERSGYGFNLLRTQSKLVWNELDKEQTRICTLNAADGSGHETPTAQCTLAETQSNSISIIGWSYYPNLSSLSVVKDIFLKITQQSLFGDTHHIIRYTPDTNTSTNFTLSEGGEPVSITTNNENTFVLIAERNKRSLRRLNPETLACMDQAPLGVLLKSVHMLNNGEIIAPIFNGDHDAVYKFKLTDLNFQPCQPASTHTSPLLVAMRAGEKNISLDQAVTDSSLWQDAEVPAQNSKNFAPLTDQRSPDQIDAKPQPSRWRPRPVLGVPWLGADSDGTQVGILSVPLMDHMQNEDIRAYFGYGLNSHFPNTEISFTSTRFWTSIKVDAFRYQTWNGRYFVYDDKSIASVSNDFAEDNNLDTDDGTYQYAYMDEKGARLSTQTFFHNVNAALTLGMKTSHLKSYIGYEGMREGQLNEPFAELSKTTRWGSYRFMQAFTARIAPSSLNKEFDYNVLGLEAALARNFDFLDGKMVWSIEASRTRGTKRRELQEAYRPLKIYVPGSGSGFNNLNFPLFGSGALYRAKYGDTQARLASNYSFPLIESVDRLVRLFYWDSLTFDAFTNAGTAWTGALKNYNDDLLVAHGYAVNANFDIKGLNFHVGSGVGQVFGHFPDLYGSFSFDAIF